MLDARFSRYKVRIIDGRKAVTVTVCLSSQGARICKDIIVSTEQVGVFRDSKSKDYSHLCDYDKSVIYNSKTKEIIAYSDSNSSLFLLYAYKFADCDECDCSYRLSSDEVIRCVDYGKGLPLFELPFTRDYNEAEFSTICSGNLMFDVCFKNFSPTEREYSSLEVCEVVKVLCNEYKDKINSFVFENIYKIFAGISDSDFDT